MTRAMLLAELLPDLPGVPPELAITGLVQDSRELQVGDAFVAMLPARQEAPSTHGMHFAAQAQAAGAGAILFEPPLPEDVTAPSDAIAVPGLRARLGTMANRFHGAPSAAMTMAGVTGTNGKTSIVQLLAQAWSINGKRAATIGTLGAGLYDDPAPTGFTTPLVLRTHALLAQLRDAGAEAVAMEVSSHGLDQGRVDGVHFDVAIFTNLTRDHLDYHGDMQAYGEAKARLFAWPGLHAAVLNLDDPYGRMLRANLAPGTHGVGVSSRGEQAEVRAENVVLDAAGVAFDVVIDNARFSLRSPLLGRFNVDNLLAVAGTLHALGDASAAIAATLEKLQPIPGRMSLIGGDLASDGSRRPLIVVDYAHTPDALQQALASLHAHAPARLICVFGCGGERDRGKRPRMAAIAEGGADLVVVTDDNPRGEDGDAIVAEILAGFAQPDAVLIQRDRKAAIARAIGEAGPDDIVLIAGKGHERYQEIAGVQHPFDDTVIAQAALGAKESPPSDAVMRVARQ